MLACGARLSSALSGLDLRREYKAFEETMESLDSLRFFLRLFPTTSTTGSPLASIYIFGSRSERHPSVAALAP